MQDKKTLFKDIFFLLFIVASLIDVYAVYEHDKNLIFLANSFSVIFLIFYYVLSAKKVSFIFLLVLLFFLSADAFFLLHKDSNLGFVSVLLSRSLLLLIVLKNYWFLDKRHFIIVSSSFFIGAFGVLSYVFSNTFQFFLVVLIAIILILLFTTLFVKFLNDKTNGASEMFYGVSIFLVSDLFFALTKIEFLGVFEPILVSITYSFAYYFIVKAMIKKRKQNKNPKS